MTDSFGVTGTDDTEWGLFANEAPTLTLANTVVTLAENAVTTPRLKVADILVTDDALGTNVLSLSGADAGLFEIAGSVLYLKAGTALDFETNPVLNVTVEVNDATLGGAVDDSEALTITVVDASPGVTLGPATGQRNPTNQRTIHFTVVFTDPVEGFATGDVSLAGTAPGKLVAKVTAVGKTGLTYDVAVRGMKGDGTVIATIGAGVAHDAAGHGNLVSAASLITYDATKPTLTINQAANQADPTNAKSVHFTAVFSEPVIGFTTADVELRGTARGKRVESVTTLDGGRTYDVLVSGVTRNGTIIASVKAGKAQDAAGNKNLTSTSTDKTVTCDLTAPTVTINQARGQADPTATGPIHFTVLFSEPVKDFTGTDVTLNGTAGATLAIVTPTKADGKTYDVAVSGMTRSGTVIAGLAVNVAHDAAGNGNVASTSKDNTVTYGLLKTSAGRIGVVEPSYVAAANSPVAGTAGLWAIGPWNGQAGVLVREPGELYNALTAVLVPSTSQTPKTAKTLGDVSLLPSQAAARAHDDVFQDLGSSVLSELSGLLGPRRNAGQRWTLDEELLDLLAKTE